MVPESCPDGVAVTARFTLADPDNLPVALDAGTVNVTTPDVGGLRAQFTFTPQKAGPYHATAQFEPNIGVAQHDFVVAADHTAEVPAFTVSGSGVLGGCTQVEVTAQGNLLCLHPMPMLFAGDGGLVQDFGTLLTSYADGALWVTDGTTVSRWLEGTLGDGGGGFVQTPEAPANVQLTDGLLIALGDSAIGVDERSFVRVSRVDGGLAVTGEGSPGSGAGSVWTDGDRIVVGGGPGSPCGWSFDAGTQRCTIQPLSQEPVGADRAGIWSMEPGVVEGAQVQVLTAFTTEQLTSIRIPDDGASDVSSSNLGWETAPSLISGGQRYVIGLKQGFTLDAYDGNATRISITSTAVTLESSGALHIYRR